MGFKYGRRSLRELEGIHPKLRLVADKAIEISSIDFMIVDGLRTIEEQRAYVAKGVSKTMRSKHLTGRALDFVALVNGIASYERRHMTTVALAFKDASLMVGVPIVWGGDWKSFVDTPHIELDPGVS